SHPLQGGVNPTVGSSQDTYTYSIIYTGSGTPAVHVTIDGTSYPMSYIEKNSQGALYQYKTRVKYGTAHSFTFSTSDGHGRTVTLPDNGIPYPGPEVHPFRVTTGLSTSVALPGKKITYSAIYLSFLGKPATRAEVDIDGKKYQMTAQQGGSPKTGVNYT